MNKAPMTRHGIIEKERLEALRARRDENTKLRKGLLGKVLAHAVRFTLDVNLPWDVMVLEAMRDTEGERLLDLLRHRLDEMTVEDWRALRDGKEHVHRLLAYWRIYNPVSTVGTLRPAGYTTTQQQAERLMAGFCNSTVSLY